MPQPDHNPSKLRAWLELVRISNLPTVWTNVMTGCAMGLAMHTPLAGRHSPPIVVFAVNPPSIWLVAMLLGAGISLLYLAGMMLNDLADVKVDARERPHRPLPSGRIPVRLAARVTAAMFLAGFTLITFASQQGGFLLPGAGLAAALVGLIVAYDFSHKLTPLAVVLMGLCRGCIYVMCAFIVAFTQRDHAGTTDHVWTHPLIWGPAIAITLYTIGITVISRSETKDTIDNRKWLSIFMPILVFIAPLPWLQPTGVKPMMGATMLLMLGWLVIPVVALLRKPPKPVKAILTWLSGMCLIDAFYLAMLGQNELSGVAICCFVLTAWGHRRILGT